MTASTYVTIWCDGEDCPEWTGGDMPRVRMSRDDAKRAGWAVGLAGGKDYCPKCKRERRGA